jgi:hypothetical protein
MGARLSCIMRNLLIPCVEELETGDGAAGGGLSGRPRLSAGTDGVRDAEQGGGCEPVQATAPVRRQGR